MKKIILDLDWVLTDSRVRTYALFRALVPDASMDQDDFVRTWRKGEFRKRFLRATLHWSDAQIDDFYARWLKLAEETDSWDEASMHQDVISVLDGLRSLGYQIIVWSVRSSREALERELSYWGLDGLVDTVIPTGFVRRRQALKETLTPTRDDIIVCGCSEDIQIGAEMKILTMAACYGGVETADFRQYEPDFFLIDLKDMLVWVNMLQRENLSKMIRYQQATKGQHYVPDHFLQAWQQGDALWVGDSGGFYPSPSCGTGKKSGIYSFETFGPDEYRVALPLLTQAINDAPKNIGRLIVGYALLTIFMHDLVFGVVGTEEMREMVTSTVRAGIFDSKAAEPLLLVSLLKDAGEDVNYVKRDLKRRITEGYEPVMCAVESEAFDLIDQARAGGLSFWNDDSKAVNFLRYVAYQLFRTRKFSELIKAAPRISPKVMRLLMPLCSEMAASGMYRDKAKTSIVLLDNKTDLEFITGDQPLVNLAQHAVARYFDVYFPLSPRKAIFMCDTDRLALYPQMRDLQTMDVHNLNRRLAEQCYQQVYASQKEIIEAGGYVAQGKVLNRIDSGHSQS